MAYTFQNGKLPVICTPVTGENEQAMMQQLKTLIALKPDIIEWRADFFDCLDQPDIVLKIIRKMKQQTEIPILFTIRAMHEGGEDITLNDQEKFELILAVCKHSDVEFVDYEISNNPLYVEGIEKAAKKSEKKLILSYHNFNDTPEEKVLLERAQLAVAYGADIVKIAVMPQNKSDVFRLLEVTRRLDGMLDVPIITMSMGEIGALSRVIGWTYGSAMTFGVGAEASAPGQISVKELRDTMDAMKELLPAWIE